MIELRDSVRIETAPQTVWSWLEAMPEHILEWHPDHIDARWVEGHSFTPGAVMEVRERLHGKPHRLRMALIDVEAGRRVRYRVFPGLGGELAVEPVDGAARFTAIIRFGTKVPVVAIVVDGLLRLLFGRRIAAIERHQAEEGANLKALLEKRAQ